MKITSVTDLAELPVGSVILALFPAGAMEKFQADQWWSAGTHVTFPSARVPLPALLLWDPINDERPE